MPISSSRTVPGLRVPCDVRERGWIAEQHARPPRANLPDVVVEPRLRHVERRQQRGTKQEVAQAADPVLCAELDGRTPYDDFRIPDIHAEPARRAPLGRHIVSDALGVEVEHEWLAARAARVTALQLHATA